MTIAQEVEAAFVEFMKTPDDRVAYQKMMARLQRIEVEPSIKVELASNVMRRMMVSVQKEARGEGSDFPLYPSGLRGLDNYIIGFAPGEIAVFAARPSVGKSTLAVRIAHSFGRRGDPIAVAWLEDGAAAFGRRSISALTKTKATLLRQGRSEAIPEYLRAEKIMERCAQWPIWLITSDKAMSVHSICGMVRRLKEEKGITAFIVDHLGELKLELTENEARNYAIGTAIRAFRHACEECGVCPIVFVQENRKREDAAYKNTNASLSFIADSAEIEKAARIVGFLSVSDMPKDAASPGAFQTTMSIDLKKNTNGPKGKVVLNFYPEFMTVDDPEPIIMEAL